MPDAKNLAVRAFCRWHASWTIWSVAVVGFGPVLSAVDVVGVDVVAVCANADSPAVNRLAIASGLSSVNFKNKRICCMGSSVASGALHPSIP